MSIPHHHPYQQIDAALKTAGRQLPRLPDWWPRFLELPPDATDAGTRDSICCRVRSLPRPSNWSAARATASSSTPR